MIQLPESFTELLCKVMQKDSCTWDAIWFMNKIKGGQHTGFDCRLKFDSFGCPKAFLSIIFPFLSFTYFQFAWNLIFKMTSFPNISCIGVA
jgi:hypothetical protein